jgi:hypothetical protein
MFAGMCIPSPVRGFTPLLAFLSITRKVPKPTKVTLSSLRRQSVMAEITASTASLDVFFVSPVWSATLSTNSALSVFFP